MEERYEKKLKPKRKPSWNAVLESVLRQSSGFSTLTIRQRKGVKAKKERYQKSGKRLAQSKRKAELPAKRKFAAPFPAKTVKSLLALLAESSCTADCPPTAISNSRKNYGLAWCAWAYHKPMLFPVGLPLAFARGLRPFDKAQGFQQAIKPLLVCQNQTPHLLWRLTASERCGPFAPQYLSIKAVAI